MQQGHLARDFAASSLCLNMNYIVSEASEAFLAAAEKGLAR